MIEAALQLLKANAGHATWSVLVMVTGAYLSQADKI